MNTESNPDDKWYVGARRMPDGSFDFSRAAEWIRPMSDKPLENRKDDFTDRYRALLSPDKDTLLLPDNWLKLYHGSNLTRAEWQGEKRKKLDADTLTINVGTGLSVISDRDKEKEKMRSVALTEQNITNRPGSTTETYSSTSNENSEPLEIQIAFPAFHHRIAHDQAILKRYEEKYGKDRMKQVMDFSNTVHWQNHQSGRHPLLPRGTVLFKIHDAVRSDGVRVVQYIPEKLKDIYLQEVENKKSENI